MYDVSVLEGTKLLPLLANKKWESTSELLEDGLTKSQQLSIRRAYMRVEILKKESDPQSKYELFQRLKTGGSTLSPQEIRNCVMLMVNRDFFQWIMNLAEYDSFKNVVAQTENAERKQRLVELALRFFVYRNVPYKSGLDVNEYLDNGMISLASNADFNTDEEGSVFHSTFDFIQNTVGENAFKRYDGSRFLVNSHSLHMK